MFDTSQWSQLEGLMFTARQLVEGLYAGGHASARQGPGLEFHDYRPYVPGDAVADIDWKRYGRTDRYYLRRYQRYTDLQAYLLVDISASMDFADVKRSRRPSARADARAKLDVARELAVAIAMLTIRQGDRVGLGLFDKKLQVHIPPGSSFGHFQSLCHALETCEVGEGEGDIAASLKQVHGLLKRRGLVVIISDLLDEPGPLFDALHRLRHDRFEVAVFQVLSDVEMDLNLLGQRKLQLVDSESRRQVPTDAGQMSRRYNHLMNEHIQTLARGCVGRGIDHNVLSTCVIHAPADH
jgi:uncharacterized protein (DUF58 family)